MQPKFRRKVSPLSSGYKCKRSNQQAELFPLLAWFAFRSWWTSTGLHGVTFVVLSVRFVSLAGALVAFWECTLLGPQMTVRWVAPNRWSPQSVCWRASAISWETNCHSKQFVGVSLGSSYLFPVYTLQKTPRTIGPWAQLSSLLEVDSGKIWCGSYEVHRYRDVRVEVGG
jgi:hypothetical protein